MSDDLRDDKQQPEQQQTANEQRRPGPQRASLHWLDEIFKEHEQKGDFDDLPGKGKPIAKESLQGDTFNNVLKNANFLPPWLELQHDIRDAIGTLLERIKRDDPALNVNAEIKAINKKIKKYNFDCPTPVLQKAPITADNIQRQYEYWK
ncbi:DnaJ family domain-containing protein [Numidum massiliense]|uniref:DnaJ family domain-containing protein n=1 Tax=Numidum massiliense TaxID=1522315 RepID=UPI0006D55870|nr:DUF1992 domain-containing protein [Numidum massiliense]